jgi:hypothetical protein
MLKETLRIALLAYGFVAAIGYATAQGMTAPTPLPPVPPQNIGDPVCDVKTNILAKEKAMAEQEALNTAEQLAATRQQLAKETAKSADLQQKLDALTKKATPAAPPPSANSPEAAPAPQQKE